MGQDKHGAAMRVKACPLAPPAKADDDGGDHMLPPRTKYQKALVEDPLGHRSIVYRAAGKEEVMKEREREEFHAQVERGNISLEQYYPEARNDDEAFEMWKRQTGPSSTQARRRSRQMDMDAADAESIQRGRDLATPRTVNPDESQPEDSQPGDSQLEGSQV